jgi:dihydrofolate synthase/folylpolyglutamate synthase
VRLPGRFQRVPGEVEWIFDVAHTVPAALGLVTNLRALPRAYTIAVCGILGDKDLQGITAALRDDVDAWVLVSLDGPRAVPTQELAKQLPDGARILAHAPDVIAGCRLARDAARPGDRILVFGSFLTVGPALEFLGPEFVRL